MDIDNITSIKSPIINKKSYTQPFNCDCFMFLADKSPVNLLMFPKHKGLFLFQNLFLWIDIFL